MPIFICKNCGNLTESEKVEGLACSTCGAALDDAKQKEEEKPAQPKELPPSQPVPEQITADQAKPDQKTSQPPAPEQKPASAEQKSPESPAPEETPLEQAPIDLPESREPPRSPPRPAVAGPSSTRSHVFMGATNEIMEVYENKNLVACPRCSYGCEPAWEKCPICEAKISGASELQKISESDFSIDEEKLKEKLVPCPKCNYFCDPNWTNCPICQTELKKSN